MAYERSVIVALVLISWKLRFSCTESSTVLPSLTVSKNLSTTPTTSSPTPSTSFSSNSSKISINQTTPSSPVINTSTFLLSKSNVSSYADNSSSPVDVGSTEKTKVVMTASTNHTINTPMETSVDLLSNETVSITSTANVNSSPSRNIKNTSSSSSTPILNATLTSTTIYVLNSTFMSMSVHVPIATSTSSSFLPKNSSVLPTPNTFSTSSVNDSRGKGSTESLQSQTATVNESIQISRTEVISLSPNTSSAFIVSDSRGVVSTESLQSQTSKSAVNESDLTPSTVVILSSRKSSSTVQNSSSSSRTSSVDDDVMISSSVLSQSSTSTTQEVARTSLNLSPMATTEVSNSTPDSHHTSSQFKNVTTSARSSHVLLTQTLLPNTTMDLTPTSTQVYTSGLSASVSLSPSPTSTANVMNQHSSQTDGDVIVMSYMTPCYITYVITQTINETSQRPTTVAMETSVSSSLDESESQSTTKTPVATIATSTVSIARNRTSSSGSVAMETKLLSSTLLPSPSSSTSLAVSSSSSAAAAATSPLQPPPPPSSSSSSRLESSTSSATLPHSSSVLQADVSNSTKMTATQMMTANNTLPAPASMTTSTETLIVPSNTMTEISNKTVVMETSSPGTNHSASVTAVIVTFIPKSTASATASSATVFNSQASSSVGSEVKVMMNNTSSISLATTASPQLLPTTSSVTATPTYNASSSEVTSNTRTVSANTGSATQVNTGTTTISAAIQASMTTTSSGLNVTSSTPTLSNNILPYSSSTAASSGLNVTSSSPILPKDTAVSSSSSTANSSSTSYSTPSVLTPTPVLNMSVSPTVENAKRRRRRNVNDPLPSGNSSNSISGNDSVTPSTSIGLASGSMTSVLNSNASMSLASSSLSLSSTSPWSSSAPSSTSLSSSSTTSLSSLSSSAAPSSRSSSSLSPSTSGNATAASIPSSSTTASGTIDQPAASAITPSTSTSNITVAMTTVSISPALPVPTPLSHLDNRSSMVVTSDTSTSPVSANTTSSSSATPATVSMTTHSSSPGGSGNSTPSISQTPSTDNVVRASTANASMSTPAWSTSVSVIAPKSLGITVGVNHTSSQSTRTPDVNKSSTLQPVTVAMTTPSVAMTTSATSISNLNRTKVPNTSSDVKSVLVSPSKSLNVQSTSQVANEVPPSSTILFPTLTPTSIHPTPLLTSLTPPETSYIMSSVVSSARRKNILLTTSSLGICWIVFTTQVLHSSMLPTPSSVSGLNQTTSSTMSTESVVVNTSSVFSSLTPTESLVFEMNSTTKTTAAVVTTSPLKINVSTAAPSISIPQTSPSLPEVNTSYTPALNSTKTTRYVSKSIADNTTSPSPVPTSVPSVVFKATANSTVYPSTTASSLIEVSKTSSVGISSSLTSSYTGTSSLTIAASQTSSIITLNTTVSPSITTVVMATSSVVTTPLLTTTATPTTATPVLSTLMKTTLQISRNVDVNDNELRRNVSKALEEVYNRGRAARRRRRETDGTEAQIYNITRRNPPSTDAVILFTIARNGRTLPAADAVAVYDKIANLSSIGVWKVISRPEAFLQPTPPPQNVLVSMIFERISRNLSVPSNKKAMEERLASYYKTKKNTRETVTATIHVILLEKTQHVYIQFYITEGGTQVPAAVVVKVFEVEHVTQLTAYLQEQVIVAPYTDESLQGQRTDYIQTRVSASLSDMQDPSFKTKLGDKLATAYITGKAKGNSRRKRRAIGSVSATIVNVTAVNGSSDYADVIFFIFDSGKVANATYAAAVMNRLTRNEMSIITSPYAIITSPRPVIVPVATETPPATIPPVVIPYWIIGAVLGPIFLIIIIILLIYWRWRSGAPQGKVQPAVQKTPDYLRKPRMQPMQTHDEVRYSERKPPVSKIANISAATERSYENLPRRETSLRRKVTKTSIQKRPDMSRSNAAYEESEEDEDYDNSFITVSSTSHNRTITAQPGPGMKDRQTTNVPVKSTPHSTPKKILEEEEEETESSESEAESVGTARTDQTKFSAAQVPTVAVMGGSSGNPPQVPVRFRSSVHPVSSLPPIHSKPTSLVGPPSDDEDEMPRKSKRRSKAAQQELKQKADMERLRNKKRQRERKNRVAPVQSSERRAWAQDELEQVLDPRPSDPFTRSKRRKPKRSKRADSVATDEDAIELKSYKRHGSPEDTMKQPPNEEDQTEDQLSGESSDESSISMEETRKRMHTLLDDAFSLLGPLSQKQKQRPKSLEGPGDYYRRPPAPARYAGSRPTLPEPAPAHGRATAPTPRQRRRLGNTGGFPHGLPQTPIGPGYPVRRPPLVTSEPVVVWDPYERQRYINQRMGYPQGGANPTYTYMDPQGQNVYITPVQQQRDYLGGPVWSPYTAEDTMEELYPDLSKSNYPGALGTSPPKDHGFRDVNPRDTVIDMNDQFGQRGGALGQAPQPLIRSIKDELLRLSNGGVRRTPITEL